MEDVLAVHPLVCVDETSKQLIAETRVPIPMKPGRPARVDYEYKRNGTANLFMMFAPLEGWRRVKVIDHRTAIEYAQVLKELADIHFPRAKTIVLVHDNLNIHSKASLYEAFPAAEARRLVERPRPPHPQQTNPHRRNRRLGARTQRPSHQVRLALHHQRRSH